jgi:hypothetical protein
MGKTVKYNLNEVYAIHDYLISACNTMNVALEPQDKNTTDAEYLADLKNALRRAQYKVADALAVLGDPSETLKSTT